MNAMTTLKRLAVCGSLFLGAALAAEAALDLTPRRGMREGNEGPPTPVIQFSYGRGRIDYQPPADWRPGGGGRSVMFFTPDPNSWMRLVVTDKPNTGSKAVGGAENLAAAAVKFAPEEAQDVMLTKVVPSPFALGTQASTEMHYTCTLHGFRLALSISIIDINNQERLVMVVCAEPGHFEEMREKAITSMFTWSPEDR